ncbi:MAG TPA: inositol monophosphatase family protein [Candidatus Limnocylindrales bacterium]|nr:inositol monophosphatase family protein [Candidatus Limnocylindrales bacterium]
MSAASLRRGDTAELRAWLDFALALCDEADATAMASFRREVEVSTKPDRSLVTAADRAIEERLRERIRARFPDHGLVGEEFGSQDEERPVRWYLDPIDGTHNFVRGIPLFGTLLAAERDGELLVGVISAPALRSRWWALRGGGAWAAGDAAGHADAGAIGAETGLPLRAPPRRLAVSRVQRIEDAQLLYGSVGEVERSGRAPGLRSVLARAWRERGFGDFWGYALVAEGAAEAMLEVDVNAWDLAAPLVIVEEAGGRFTDLGGERAIHGRTVLASNGLLHDELLAALASGKGRAGPA